MTHDDPTIPRLKPRRADSHKGDFGRALLVGGSREMPGAISLSGMACLRGGAGLTRIATAASAQPIVAAQSPCYMSLVLPEDAHGRISGAAKPILEEAIAKNTAIACGPGLGESDELTDLAAWMYESVSQPMVCDADMLNALARRREVLRRPGGPRVLTPHPGEFRRLVEMKPDSDRQAFEARAKELANECKVVVLLKGAPTYITDGANEARNETGNPGMATGGTGDVLTGLIVALLCQGLSAFDAARLGAHVHGLAGDLAARDVGQTSLIATDLIDYLPRAFSNVGRTRLVGFSR